MKSLIYLTLTFMLFTPGPYKQPGKPYKVSPWINNDTSRCSGYLISQKLLEFTQKKIAWQVFKAFEAREREWLKQNCKQNTSSVITGVSDESGSSERKSSPANSVSVKVFNPNYCAVRRLAMVEEDGTWVFYRQRWEKNGDDCKYLEEKELFRIKSPVSQNEDGSHLILPVFVNEDARSTSALPFSIANFYWEWINTNYDCNPGTGWSSPECFYCENHTHLNSLSNGERAKNCPNFADYFAKLDEIKNGSFDFRIVVPCFKSDKVYLVAQAERKFTELPGLEAKWFDSNYVKKNFTPDLSTWFDFLTDVSLLIARNPDCQIIEKPSAGSLYAIIKGNVNHAGYVVGAGIPKGDSSSEIYTPVGDFKNKPGINEKIMNILSDDSRLTQMIRDRFENNSKASIEEVLPASWAKSDDPLQALGGATTLAAFYNKLDLLLNNKVALDLLIREGSGDLYVWQEGRQKIKLKEQSNYYSQPFIDMQKLVVIADPELKELASNTDNRKWVFFFKNSGNIWSWINNNNLTQYEVLRADDALEYTGVNCSEYFKELKENAGPAEKEFFLEYADNPNGFKLADVFFLKNNFRIVLYRKTNKALAEYQVINRFSNAEDAIAYTPFKLFKVGEVSIPSMYNVDWKRALLQEKFIRDTVPKNMELWLSKSYLGFYKKNTVSVYLECKKFENISFEQVLDNIKPGYHLKKNIAVDHKLLFSSWLKEKWESDVWRANPLGFLARNSKI